jgi:hypothetical protein
MNAMQTWKKCWANFSGFKNFAKKKLIVVPFSWRAQGVNVMFFLSFRKNISQKVLAFLTLFDSSAEKVIITLVFIKTAKFFADNW